VTLSSLAPMCWRNRAVRKPGQSVFATVQKRISQLTIMISHRCLKSSPESIAAIRPPERRQCNGVRELHRSLPETSYGSRSG
jgi:hypothetical protein